jgi:hypothetical protein
MENEHNKTLGQAQAELKQKLNKGATCPCCGQYAKIYRRTITSSMAYALILIYKTGSKEWIHVENYLKSIDCPSPIRGDVSKLRYWGLLDKKEEVREDGSDRNGMYRITDKGILFVQGKLAVPKHAFIFNNLLNDMSKDEDLTITKALKSKFNYKEVMGAAFQE